jgi:hypothetical protein
MFDRLVLYQFHDKKLVVNLEDYEYKIFHSGDKIVVFIKVL